MYSNVAESGNMRVKTEVLAPTDPRLAQLKNTSSPQQIRDSIVAQMFKKGQPKALGTVQIIVGLLQVCFGIILTTAETAYISLTNCSGMYFWVGISFFISGCVTVAAETNDIPRLVKVSVGTNVLGLLLASIALILHSVEIQKTLDAIRLSQEINNESTSTPSYYREPNSSGEMLRISSNAVFLIFVLLEMATTITILVFGWKALRNIEHYSPMN